MKKAQEKTPAKISALIGFTPEVKASLNAILYGREQTLCRGWKISENVIEDSLVIDNLTWKNGPIVEMLHGLVTMKTVDTIYVLEEHKSTLPQREAFHKRYLTQVAGFEVEEVSDVDAWIVKAQNVVKAISKSRGVDLRIYLKLSKDGTLEARLFNSDRGHLQIDCQKGIPEWEYAVVDLMIALSVNVRFWQMRYCSIGEYTSEYIQGYLNSKK